MLRKYSSRDLRDADIYSDSDEEMIKVFGDIGGIRGYYDDEGDKSIHIRKGYEDRALHHEMGHFLTDRKYGTTDPPKYGKYLAGRCGLIMELYCGSQAVEDEGEILAEGFWMMMQHPTLARGLMRRNQEMKEFFDDIMNNLGYRISGMRRRKR